MASAIGEEGLTEEVKHGTLLLATGFNDGEDTLNEKTAQVRLGAMRRAPPEDRMTQRSLHGDFPRLSDHMLALHPFVVHLLLTLRARWTRHGWLSPADLFHQPCR
ncbi:MAG TPA: hypothetical protein VMT24_02400 [Aggregatilineaceae bacterium]|nr:hypothetical protein [Aggregatilineaceae bacterium]